jgi:predicted branched-subunit amino acid permease
MTVEPTKDTPPPPTTTTQPWATTAVVVLSAVIVAIVAGLLAHANGSAIPGAILTGGAAFAGAVALFLAIGHSLSSRK